jgi:hypothetical protein
MILVRDVFQLKMGKAKEAIGLMREAKPMWEKMGIKPGSMRVLTDLVGTYYTMVLEMTVASLSEWEANAKKHMPDAQWQAWHAKFQPLTEGGHREIFNIVE